MSQGRPSPSQVACNLVIRPPLVMPIKRAPPLSHSHTAGYPVRLTTGRIDHYCFDCFALFGYSPQHSQKDSFVSPSPPTAVRCPVRIMDFRCIPPTPSIVKYKSFPRGLRLPSTRYLPQVAGEKGQSLSISSSVNQTVFLINDNCAPWL